MNPNTSGHLNIDEWGKGWVDGLDIASVGPYSSRSLSSPPSFYVELRSRASLSFLLSIPVPIIDVVSFSGSVVSFPGPTRSFPHSGIASATSRAQVITENVFVAFSPSLGSSRTVRAIRTVLAV